MYCNNNVSLALHPFTFILKHSCINDTIYPAESYKRQIKIKQYMRNILSINFLCHSKFKKITECQTFYNKQPLIDRLLRLELTSVMAGKTETSQSSPRARK